MDRWHNNESRDQQVRIGGTAEIMGSFKDNRRDLEGVDTSWGVTEKLKREQHWKSEGKENSVKAGKVIQQQMREKSLYYQLDKWQSNGDN